MFVHGMTLFDLLSKHDEIFRRYYGHYMLAPSSTNQPLFSERTMSEVFSAAKPSGSDADASTADIRVLSAPATHALGLLATSPMPYPMEAFEKLFPHVSWKALVPQLVDAKVVTSDGTILRISEKTKSRFLPTAADRKTFTDIWLAVLEPLRHHVDMALFLGLHYLASEDPLKAFDIIVEMADRLERGFWNNVYVSTLEAFDRPQFLKRLPAEKRRSYFSAYGLCIARGNDPAKAMPWARRLLLASKKAGDHWGVAQAYLLFGLAHQYIDNSERAAHYYDECSRYAKRHRIYLLVGHALHNLAMLQADDEPAVAAKLLEQNIRGERESTSDEPGRVGALFGRGSLAVSQRQYEAAQKWFARAERLAAKWDMQHSRALALSNIGNALVDQGKPRDSLSYYSEAITIADAEGYPDASAYALGGSANANLSLKRYQRAHDLFLQLKSVRTEMGDHEAAVVAHHAAGECLLFHKRTAEARTLFAAAYDEAVRHELPEWIYRCAKDMALIHKDSGDIDLAIIELRESAKREEDKQRLWVSAKLWESVATLLHECQGESVEIEKALESAVRSLQSSEEHFDELVRLISGLYQRRWDSGLYERAMDALRTLANAAKAARNRDMQTRAVDQIGMCLQELGRIVEAIPYHRRALQMSRRLPTTELAENCLNNLGEAFRKSGTSDAAIPLFEEAEGFARKRTDTEAEISIAHNRALALEDINRKEQAYQVLVRCRDIAFKGEHWEQHVRALHGLANHAWLTSKADEAVVVYREALQEARRHNLNDQATSIAINYAEALRYKSQNKQAFRVLESVAINLPQTPGNHVFYSVFAASAAENGKKARAKEALGAALKSAEAANDGGIRRIGLSRPRTIARR